MRKIMCFVLTVICLLAVAGCGGGAKKADATAGQKAAAEKVLRVGTNANYPPFEYYQEASKTFIKPSSVLISSLCRAWPEKQATPGWNSWTWSSANCCRP